MKKLLAIVLSLLTIVMFVSCSKENDDKTTENENNDTENNTVSTEEITTKPVETKLYPDVKEVLVEDNVITVADKCEFALDFSNITDDVLPPTPSSYYSHYVADNGKVYIDICFSYKNLGTSDISADETMSGTLYFGGKYNYKGFSIVEEDNRGDFTYSSITSIAPLSTSYVHYLFLVPELVKDSDGELYVVMQIAGNSYGIKIREGVITEVADFNEAAVKKDSGTVTDGEVVSVKNKYEFKVDYSKIASKIEPVYPSSYYSYYEAEDGKVYVDICFEVKSFATEGISADDIFSAKIKYADKYDYTGFSIIEEDNRGDFTYSSITSVTPLTTEYIHYLFEVPEEVAESTESVVVIFSIGGNNYSYQVR